MVLTKHKGLEHDSSSNEEVYSRDYRSIGVIMSVAFRSINDRDTTHIVISEFGLSDVCWSGVSF